MVLPFLTVGCRTATTERSLAEEIRKLESELVVGQGVLEVRGKIKENEWIIQLDDFAEGNRLKLGKNSETQREKKIVGFVNKLEASKGQETIIRFVLFFNEFGVLTDKEIEHIVSFL